MRESKTVSKEERVITAITCDKCGKRTEYNPDQSSVFASVFEFQEYKNIYVIGGYGSIFGDGTMWEADFCQHCLKELIGQYMKKTADY